ncbi:hypothetical protein [Asticcacaulis sp. AND118]|uniref:hypothetical protein n=1 Tax=Asticcacaulis sp. AND118 TaxID=2840468 RepID=UPI001CFF76E9|nr:hypothetical protein [Asticcacaulis sp. AND118]UDF04862.1 hypothetical protein LH365_15785 [Asticcacaulis sp. AND118]
MKIETLERLWRAHDRDPDRTAQACLLESLMTTIERRRNGQNVFLLCVGAALGTITLVFGYDIIRHEGFDPAREWGALLMLAAPWIALILMKRAHDRHVQRFPDPGASISENLRVRLDENRTARQGAVVMLWLMGLFPILTGIALWQLTGTDKMTVAQAMQGALVFSGVLGASTVAQILRYRLFLRPEGERLTRLLAEYEI